MATQRAENFSVPDLIFNFLQNPALFEGALGELSHGSNVRAVIATSLKKEQNHEI